VVGLPLFGVNQMGLIDIMYEGAVFGAWALVLAATALWHLYFPRPLIPRCMLGSRAVSYPR
jgi:hypothetical protein